MAGPAQLRSGAVGRRSRRWPIVACGLGLLTGALIAVVLLVDPASRPPVPLRGLGDSVAAFLDAVRALGRRLSSVELWALGGALALSAGNILVRSLAWRNIIAAAYPASPVRRRWIAVGSYAGVGANAVLPARVGDALRLFLVHGKVEGSSYPTLASTLIAETAFDMALGVSLLVWAWQAGLLPAAPDLPRLPLFEISWYAGHPWIVAAIAAVAVVLVVVAERRVRAFWERVGQGLVILTEPRRYVRQVALFQAVAWGCRVAAAYLFLRAFGVDATLRNALLVQVASSLSTLVPATPGGLGPRQALYIVLLSGAASREELLAFGVGTGLALAVWNALLGFTILGIALRGKGLRRTIRHARGAGRNATDGSSGELETGSG